MRWLFVAAVSLAACSNRASQSKLEPALAIAPGDGGSASTGAAAAQTAKPTPDDSVGSEPDVPRAAKPIGIHLRSSPSGARVTIDGVVVGTTPTYWSGAAAGRQHEFTFTLAEHQAAHYRFVPVTSGVIHARLVPIGETGRDAGVPPTSVQ